MDRLIEFASNHYLLVSAFFLLWAVFFTIESRRGGKPISPQLATNLINQQNGVIIDLRDGEEFRAGHIAGSVNIPSGQVMDQLSQLQAYKDRPVILACKMGNQSSHLGRQLRGKGIPNLYRIQGGINAWRNDNLPVVKA
ncbi:Rhodanese-like domain protein [Alloalcanivorax dieselolei B5]|uniref:Rhodanese-like domain protein n=2 Tax=Alloalcanivorax TaxID=3020832 RepID=K0C8P9_ALCDB|nr:MULTISPECIES: rhodanese-like domain-containing protein [Alloalcanivorax]AFT68895.1 Rhodanese-like domain protein [Alloalcanivorax dieselolei B5]MCU5784418.1 rhodanese domain-containing protein [Alloalcanivorax balearicus MACL04]GGJ80985.1 rhodanese-like domain-containing protein [Alloalcanivorax dieselolei]